MTSVLRHSQAEQLLSGLERRIVQISLSSLRRALWNLLPWPSSVECEPAVVQRSARVRGASSLQSASDPLLSVPTHLIKFTLFHHNCVGAGDRAFGNVSYPVSAKRLKIFQEWTTQRLSMCDPCVLNRDSLDRWTNKVGWCLEIQLAGNGDAKDVAWMPHKANKLCTFMQRSKWANNHTQTERPCLNTWLSPSSVLTSTIVWGGLQCWYICQSRLRALTHEPDSRLSGAIYMHELWRGNTVLQFRVWNTHNS